MIEVTHHSIPRIVIYIILHIHLTCDEDLREKIHRYAPVNVDALLDRACFLRGGNYKCWLEELIIGSENIVITLHFEDDLEWISKLPWKQHHRSEEHTSELQSPMYL